MRSQSLRHKSIFAARLALFRKIIDRRPVKILGVIWFCISFYDTALSQIIPASLGAKFPKVHETISMTSGFLPIWGWLLILAAILIISSIEYAFRHSNNQITFQEKVAVSSSLDGKGPRKQIQTFDDTKVELASEGGNELSNVFSVNLENKDIDLLIYPDSGKRANKDAVLLLVYGCEKLLHINEDNENYISNKLVQTRSKAPNVRKTVMETFYSSAFLFDAPEIVGSCVEEGDLERIALSKGGRLRLTWFARERTEALARDLNRRA